MIPPNGYLLLLCDELDFIGDYIHTNFNLDVDGGSFYVYAPSGNKVLSFVYPAQSSFHSWGLDAGGGREYKYLYPQSPRKENRPTKTFTSIVEKPQFGSHRPFSISSTFNFFHQSHITSDMVGKRGGMYNQSVLVRIESKSYNATVYYTTDSTVLLPSSLFSSRFL